jgi:hypothetical protein
VKYNLDNTFEVQGVIKPGADLMTITNTANEEVKKLSTDDVVVVCGGTKDVGKNESTNGLSQLKDFVSRNSHTNIIQICVPHRYDLHENSCVNKEVEVFNRKLRKQMKVFENIALITLNLNRDLFTKHGLHLNNKGKELAARKIVSSIKHMLHKKTKEPIYMTWKDDYVKGTQENLNSQEYQVRGHEEERNSPEKERGMSDSQDLQADRRQDLNEDVTTTVPSKRIRKPPVTRKDDFLWMDISRVNLGVV